MLALSSWSWPTRSVENLGSMAISLPGSWTGSNTRPSQQPASAKQPRAAANSSLRLDAPEYNRVINTVGPFERGDHGNGCAGEPGSGGAPAERVLRSLQQRDRNGAHVLFAAGHHAAGRGPR